MKTAKVMALMPVHIKENVHLVVKQDGVIFIDEQVLPEDKRVVSVNVPGEYGSSTIVIYINDKIYASYDINFDGPEPVIKQTVDNIEGFTP